MNSIRVRFTRGEEIKFISHLDLMKVFERAIRRSGLPISYSQGFNPHPQMVFGLPLSVGVTSNGEYADFEMAKDTRPEQFMEILNRTLPDGIRITAAAEKCTKTNIMASVTAADYELDIFLNNEMSLEEANYKLEQFMKMECIKVLKEGKGTAKEMDIRPLILEARFEQIKKVPFGYEAYPSAFTALTRFSAGSASNLRPELFIKALVEYAGIMVVTSRLHRKALYVEKNGELKDPIDSSILECPK